MIDLNFARKVNAFLAVIPASISSWYRTQERNKIVGGSSNSAHTKGVAVDLILDTAINLESALYHAEQLGFSGIEYDYRNHHLHLDDHPDRQGVWHVVVQKDGSSLPLVAWRATLA